jgi:hypothetical protein
MRNALQVLAVLCGIALLNGMAIPAGAQDDTPDEGTEAAPIEETPADAAPTEAADTEPALEETPLETSDATAAEETAPEAVEPSEASADALSAPDSVEASEAAGEADETAVTEEGEGEEPAEEEAPAHHHGPALTFANSFFSYTNAVNLHTFDPSAQLTYDPTWQMSFSLTPRFYLTDTTFLWLNQGMQIELTDSNSGTYNHEPILYDTTLDLRQNLAWEGFVFQGAARVVFPVSKASQAARRIVQTGLTLTATRPFPELASFTVSGTFGYRRWWGMSNVAQIQDGAGPEYSTPTGAAYCEAVGGARPSLCTQAGGTTNARDMILTGLSFTVMPFAGLTVQFSAFYLGLVGDDIAPAEVEINGGGTTVVDDSPTHWRHFTSFVLAVGYDVLPYLNLSLGLQNSSFAAPLYNPDGSVRSPFNADTQVYLTMTLGLDGIYGEIVGGSDEEELTPQERQRRRQGLARRGQATTF